MKLTRECKTHGTWDGLIETACPRCLVELRDELKAARLLLIRLSNEAGACSGMVGAREFLGNTNLACLELRIREAREWLQATELQDAAP